MGNCECSDPGCPACGGKCDNLATITLWRIDMTDETGTVFCEACASDALEAGVFTDIDPDLYLLGMELEE